MRIVLRTGLLALIVAGAPHAMAQQGWAPVITPSDAKTQPLPRMRGAMPRTAPEAATEPGIKSIAVVPLPFPEHRNAIREPASSPTGATPARADGPPPEPSPPETPLARNYCANIGTLASDAKFAWQKKAIGELAAELEERIARLEAKTKEYQAWLARRDEFSKRVTDNLVSIYSRMRPEAAGQQLTAMDEETAAAVLMKLDTRVASAILNDMNPQHAARLTSIISGAARTTPSPPPSKPATPENKKS